MILKEHVELAPLTTFHIGGLARFFIDAHSEQDIQEAVMFARTQQLPLWTLGGGSNVLVSDEGIDGVVLRMTPTEITFENETDAALVNAGAGTSWDALVDVVGARGIFGIENLAGIPGTLGGAAVQNIGAYGAELAQVFEYADTINRVTGERRRVTRAEALFAYRTSIFKKNHDRIITRVALRLQNEFRTELSYPDLARVKASGTPLSTPADIAQAVRAIRSQKFPSGSEEGTAGSFFKNPIVSCELADALLERFPDLPKFAQENNQKKISLAWLLDHALQLKGYAVGNVRLYEKQPLVIVSRAGATAADVDAFANDIADRVFKMTHITIEREVEKFGERNFS